ncbi:MAG: 5'-nucleotidase SurE [Firmicutes bacterium ADurb.Bin080]|jgi:5'-nucleotidase|nr:5'/3'-nucleotidase SurE [Clostridiales bacterium]OQC16464.1 MAG: 5'-nucleotidase SurE [Firmicutes bacterium ADurb.Bin080]
MHILLVNDDGYLCPGIVKLAYALKNDHVITVIAPHKCNSGMAHATSFNKPIFIQEINDFPYECYSITGTPADCVKIGLEMLSGNRPDLVISGINTDYNIGTDVVYSGTSNAALEATINRIPAIAVSTKVDNEGFQYVVDYFISNFAYFFSLISSEYALNININRRSIGNTGNVITQLGKRIFSDIYLIDPYSTKGISYTLIGNPIPVNNIDDCDVEWIKKGYTTITPITPDKTDYKNISLLKKTHFNGQKVTEWPE